MTYQERYDFWCNADLPDAVFKELKAVQNDN